MCTSSFPANLSRRVCVRGRTQVEAGSRTVLGIGPGVSLSHEYEILPLTLSPLPCSANRIGKPSNGTSPVTVDTLDAQYSVLHEFFLGFEHGILLITSLVQYTSLVRSAGRPQSLPHSYRKDIKNSIGCRCSDYLPFFIVLERLNAAEISVTCLDEVLQPIIKKSLWTLYVREALHSVAKTASGGHGADTDPMRDTLTLRPLERFPRCTIQRGSCIARNPVQKN